MEIPVNNYKRIKEDIALKAYDDAIAQREYPYPFTLINGTVLHEPGPEEKRCNYWIQAPSDYGKTRWLT